MEKEKMNFFRKFFALKIHGKNLFTSATAQWMFIARVIVFIMATVECLSWGYLGSLLGNDEDPKSKYLTAALVGGFIFLVVWMVDITLMSLDRYKRYYHSRIFHMEDKETERKTNILMTFLKDNSVQISVFFRVVMVAMSMVITAPFLNQLIFHEEIDKYLSKAQEKAIEDKKQAIENIHIEKIASVQSKIESLEKQYYLEVSGKGATGLRGEGPSSNSLRKLIKDNKKEKTRLEEIKKAELEAFSKAHRTKNYALLESNWNVALPKYSLIERGKAMTQLKQDAGKDHEENYLVKTEIAIKAFLSFLFLAMLLLKFFEPHGVRIYLSEALQQAYLTYQQGGYNQWLKQEEYPDGQSPMQPFRFEEFMVDIYPDLAWNARNRMKNDEIYLKIDNIEKAISIVEDRKAKKEIRIKEQVSAIRKEMDTTEAMIERKEQEIAEIEKEIKGQREHLRHHDIEAKQVHDFAHSNGSAAQTKIMAAKAIGDINHNIREINKAIHKLEVQLQKANFSLKKLQSARAEQMLKIAAFDQALAKYDDRINELNEQLMNLLISHATEQQPTL